jgi:transcriptional regulator with XRE-family HTH domain
VHVVFEPSLRRKDGRHLDTTGSAMIVRKLRLRKGWSQDQLAELADVSVRTIQRIERGHKPSLETANALAAVFEVDVTTFTAENDDMTRQERLQRDEVEAMEYAKGVKDFLSGVVVYFILAICFFTISGFGEPLLYLIFGAVGLGLAIQGLLAYEIIRLPFQNLERKIAEKKLGRKL